MPNSKPFIPKSLRPGSRIGIAAPAGPFNPDKFSAGIKILEDHGFEPFIPFQLTTRKGYLAGGDIHRAEVIQRRLRDSVGDMSHWNEFDYVIVNDDFDKAVNDLGQTLGNEGAAFASSRPELAPLLENLLGS